jgi:hypothetical protein
MKTNYLFPHSFKKISGILLLMTILIHIILAILNKDENVIELQMKVFAIIYGGPKYFGLIENNILDEILMTFYIVNGLIFAFSKEKVEDEMVSKIRLESLVWATYVNYAILLFCIIFIYSFSFLDVMIYNMFTLLLFFIIRFHWMLYKNNKTFSNEE